MRILIQRVLEASVKSDGVESGKIGKGLLLFVAFKESDTQIDLEYGIKKVLNLRIFDDEQGVMNRSILDVGGEILLVSQFTLYASTKKGNRPSYIAAAPAEVAQKLYNTFHTQLSQTFGKEVPAGVFGSDMKVSLINDGPVTIWVDKDSF